MDPQKIEQARQALANMTPEELIALQDGHKELQTMAEFSTQPGGEASTALLSKSGAVIHLTSRSITVERAYEQLEETVVRLIGKGAQPYTHAPASKSASQDSSQSVGQTDQSQVRTGKLEQFTITREGQAQFEVTGMHFPLKDSRGPDAVRGLFKNVPWVDTIDLSEPGLYTPRNFGELTVEFHKPGKYWDVLSIHP